MESTHLVVRRDQLAEREIVTLPRDALSPGEVELRVDLFGLTANNVAYGLRRDDLSYWRCFPEPRADWGRLPVWGFGTVVRTAAEDVLVGERFYGYYPMSSHLVVHPKRVDSAGFIDGTPHRRDFNIVFNEYLRTTHDPSYHPDTEPHQVVLRPLFAGSFFLADYLREYQFFDAETLVVSSASSKLACGIAAVLANHGKRDRRKLIGLTAERNAAFVTQTGLFDRVVPYPDVAGLPSTQRAVFIDVAGNPAIRAAVHLRLGAALKHSLMVGTTQSASLDDVRELPGPEPVPFFTPAWIRHRSQQWTPDGVKRRLADAWRAFIAPFLELETSWMSIAAFKGTNAVLRAYDEVVGGNAPAGYGHVLSL